MGYVIMRNGRVTLPKRMREVMGVTPGEKVDFRLNEHGELVVQKASADSPPPKRSVPAED